MENVGLLYNLGSFADKIYKINGCMVYHTTELPITIATLYISNIPETLGSVFYVFQTSEFELLYYDSLKNN